MSNGNDFPTLINKYIFELGCTAKDLAIVSGISETLLSRYRSGQRIPTEEQVLKLVKGILQMDRNRRYEEKKVREELLDVLPKPFPYEQFQARWSSCIRELHVNIAQMARYLHYDASYLSRITSGQRHPAHPEQFIENSAQFLARYYNTADAKQFFASAMNVPVESIHEESDYESLILQFLMTAQTDTETPIEDFLESLDRFDVNAYIRNGQREVFDFRQIEPLSPNTSLYYDPKDVFDAEKKLLATLMQSSGDQTLYIYNEIPSSDNISAEEYYNIWSNSLATLLARGMHIHVIHVLERPVQSLIRWLIGWIPLYMTGQVHPYFNTRQHSGFVVHSLMVSPTVALFGEKIPTQSGAGMYLLTNDTQGIAYFHQQIQYILSKAKPMIEFYDIARRKEYDQFLRREMEKPGARRRIMESLPVYTMPKSFLKNVLNANFIRGERQEQILRECGEFTDRVMKTIEKYDATDEIVVLTRQEFEREPVRFFLPNSFVEKDIFYSYEQYKEHLNATREFAKKHPNYHLIERKNSFYKNLQFTIKEGDWLCISKNSVPALHIVFRHEKIREAIESILSDRYDEEKKE